MTKYRWRIISHSSGGAACVKKGILRSQVVVYAVLFTRRGNGTTAIAIWKYDILETMFVCANYLQLRYVCWKKYKWLDIHIFLCEEYSVRLHSIVFEYMMCKQASQCKPSANSSWPTVHNIWVSNTHPLATRCRSKKKTTTASECVNASFMSVSKAITITSIWISNFQLICGSYQNFWSRFNFMYDVGGMQQDFGISELFGAAAIGQPIQLDV